MLFLVQFLTKIKILTVSKDVMKEHRRKIFPNLR